MKSVCTRFLFFLLCSLGTRVLFAKEIVVCTSGCAFTSIQSAINAAADGDSIFINVNGVITESGITVSKRLTIRGLGQDATIVQGHTQTSFATHRIFYVTAGAIVTLENLTIQNGKETDDPTHWKGSGGGVLIDGSLTSVRLHFVTIKNCENTGVSSNGAAIALNGHSTSLELNHCVLEGNASDNGGGGALYLNAEDGDCFVRNTGFQNNLAAKGSGGAIFLGPTVTGTFINCNFTGNQASHGNSGGAIYASNAVPTFNNCVFISNTADSQGGAMRIGGANIANCSFFNNMALGGGAISRGTASADNELYLNNCTLLNNAAKGEGPAGAGLQNDSPTALIHIENTVIAKSTSGSDVYLNAASTLRTNEKNFVGQARFATGFASFADR